MKSFDLKPTDENLIQTLKEDLLNRNEDLKNFYNILCSQKGAFSVALDGRWGSGKTFFVKQANLLINANNEQSLMDKELKQSVQEIIKIEENDACLFSVYYDAWDNDDDDDPILSIIYAITKQLNIDFSLGKNKILFKIKKTFFIILEKILEKFEAISKYIKFLPKVGVETACDIVEVVDEITTIIKSEEKDVFKDFCNKKSLEQKLKEFFSNIIPERGNRMIIFIDELDRCKPSYAVKLLERIKHYFGEERITIVFSVNLLELQHTIKHYYGNDLDADRYLSRFFDLILPLSKADTSGLYENMRFDKNVIIGHIFSSIVSKYNLQIREINKYSQSLKMAIDKYMGKEEKCIHESDELLLIYIIPVAIGLRVARMDDYYSFINGNSVDVLIDIYRDNELMDSFGNYIKSRGGFETVIDIERKVNEVYYSIFPENDKYNTRDIFMGNLLIKRDAKIFVQNVVNLHSNYANYID